MIDKIGRNIDYARISLTDRCNLNCIYCMPKGEIINFLDKSKILSSDDIYYISDILSNLGIQKIKLTGGEPLLRNDIIQIIQKIYSIDKIKKVTLTTNGVLLYKYLDRLYENNIRDINISLDSLSPQKYNQITNFKLDSILSILDKLLLYDDINIKINVVPINISDEDIISMANLAKNTNIKVRFIEIMPIGYGNKFNFLSNEDILSSISNVFGLYKISEKVHGNGPATYVHFENFVSDIGFISAVSHVFCKSCNRIRITCDGKLKPCLDFNSTLDIKELILNNTPKEEITIKIKNAIYNKPKSHSFDNLLNEDKDRRKMYQIGG